MTAKTDPGRMQGGIRRPRGPHGTWSFVINLGPQPAQRCERCGHREWLRRVRLTACPKCGGPLRDTIERRQQVSGGFATKATALKARTEALHELGQGMHVSPDKITLGEYLELEWTPLARDGGPLARTTLAGYRAHVRNHLAPTKLGTVPMQELTREKIKAHFVSLKTEGRCDGEDKPLSAASLRRILATLSKALNDAVEARILPMNPATRLPLPKVTKPAPRVWSSEQVSQFLTSAKGDDLAPLWLLVATTGMRRGEVLGLHWRDVDLATAKLTIRRAVSEVGGVVVEGQPKTAESVRTLELSPVAVTLLRRHRTAQKVARLASGLRRPDMDLVFAGEAGEWLSPSRVSAAFIAAVKRSGLPKLSLHGLRHSWATIAIVELGVDVTTVSKQLGHANVSTTQNIYSHALPDQAKAAAIAVATSMVPEGF